MLPEFPMPGWVKVAVTPLGRVLLERVTLPVKLERVRLTLTFCELPPQVSVTELGFTLLRAMLGGLTVRLKDAVTEVTPLPLAVKVID